MEPVKHAVSLIRSCESSIRALMESALNDRRYRDLAQLTSLASALSEIGGNEAEEGSYSEAEADRLSPELLANPARTKTRRDEGARRQRSRGGADQYPRFERSGDRLVKVGWSKKDKASYEHKAPKESVLVVLEKIASSVGQDGFLRMEDVLPVTQPDGSEIPSYQAYLVLAWLRALGAVHKHGNDGYTVTVPSLNTKNIERFWNDTPVKD